MQTPSGPTPEPPARSPEPPLEDVPGYRDLVPIGHGGFSLVYRAEQEALGRPVALKILLVASDQDAQRRFLREVELTSRLTGHPHVVTVLDAGTTGAGRPYLVTDLYDRGSLKDRLKLRGPLPAPDVALIGAKIADALEAAHGVGVLHRDVKPNNILVSRFGEPALADFGVACVLDGVASETMLDSFSPYYAAPEVVGRGNPSAVSDVYALGATLYELLTGKPPFGQSGENLAAILWQIMNDPAPRAECPGLPGLADAVHKALAKEPGARYPSAGAFAQALWALVPGGAGAAAGTEAGGGAEPAGLEALGFEPLAGSGGSGEPSTRHQTPVTVPLAEGGGPGGPPSGPAYSTDTSRVFGRQDPAMTMLRPDRAAPAAGVSGDAGRRRRWPMLGGGVAVVGLLGVAAALAWPSSSPAAAKNPGKDLGKGGSTVAAGDPAARGGAGAVTSPGAPARSAGPGAVGPGSDGPPGSGPVPGATASGPGAATSGFDPGQPVPSGPGDPNADLPPLTSEPGMPPPPPPPPPHTTTKPPVSTSCTGWKYQNNSNGYAYMNGSFHLEIGPYETCRDIATAASGSKLYFWCYVVNADNHKWVYARIDGTSTAGWMSYANFKGVTGSLNHC